MKCRRALPGSVLADGSVIDHRGLRSPHGPCFMPANYGARLRHVLGRCRALELAGWRMAPVRDWPSMAPRAGLLCIVRRRA